MLKINIITIFPDVFKESIAYSILKRAQSQKLVEFNIINLRDFAKDNYGTIDNHPYGGGPGMVMMLEPVHDALKSLSWPVNVIVPSVKGVVWNQTMAQDFSLKDELTFIVPHFEGIDERVIENLSNYEISLGHYVLSGGELPALVIIDTIVRLIPGALGNPESLSEESFSSIIEDKEYPQYTRPAKFINEKGEEWNVPDVLLSGNHEDIKKWRKDNIKI